MKRKMVAGFAAVCLGLIATSSVASAFEDVGSTASIKSEYGKTAVQVDNSDDDESFFSGGSNPAVSSLRSAPTYLAHEDVIATCRAVLAEPPVHYNARFYEGCRSTVTQHRVRRAAR